MMREDFAVARQRLEIETVDLIDLSATPWRRIMLSARENIWTLVDAEDHAWLSENIWNLDWVSKAQNIANRHPRHAIPSLDSIVLELLATLGPRPQTAEIPF